jgi:hypothetical protein
VSQVDEDGKVVSETAYWDAARFFSQTGALPPPAGDGRCLLALVTGRMQDALSALAEARAVADRLSGGSAQQYRSSGIPRRR